VTLFIDGTSDRSSVWYGKKGNPSVPASVDIYEPRRSNHINIGTLVNLPISSRPAKLLEHFAQPIFQHLLIRALAAAVEPGLELADTDGVFGLGLLDEDVQAGREAEPPLTVTKLVSNLESLPAADSPAH
jgi:hypothetical protein